MTEAERMKALRLRAHQDFKPSAGGRSKALRPCFETHCPLPHQIPVQCHVCGSEPTRNGGHGGYPDPRALARLVEETGLGLEKASKPYPSVLPWLAYRTDMGDNRYLPDAKDAAVAAKADRRLFDSLGLRGADRRAPEAITRAFGEAARRRAYA